ncbi:ParA family protein [Sulfuricurvum sp.]|uniref:ParA family protein n=1 Tax=Sulfuricurvum sp. TaxID=2025608 RepID=UPI00262B228D|nr:ParA family protein [Sulfuricurvum sp.]MDD3597438.1 ParA family protein [Sulfuricurvum sp.]
MNGRIITIAHQKGGVGKSTIAANLAVELSKLHPTKILDMDVQRSLSAFATSRGDRSPKLNMLPVVAKPETLMKMMNEHEEGILLIDTGGFDVDIQRIAMYGADLIITPVGDSPAELHGLSVFEETIQKLRESRPDLKASIVLNRVHMFAGKSLDDLMKGIIVSTNNSFEPMGAVLRDRKAFKESFYKGESVVEMDKNSEAAKEIKMLIDDILKRLQ